MHGPKNRPIVINVFGYSNEGGHILRVLISLTKPYFYMKSLKLEIMPTSYASSTKASLVMHLLIQQQ